MCGSVHVSALLQNQFEFHQISKLLILKYNRKIKYFQVCFYFTDELRPKNAHIYTLCKDNSFHA